MTTSISSDYNYCITVGQTDVGRHRKANEDHGSHFITINGLVSLVCDGMGGHVGGAIASEIAINAIQEFLNRQYYEDPREAIGLAIEAANQAIIQKAMIDPQLSGMGSTCVLLIVRDAKVYIGHVGDSRIYLIRERRITQLTKDHSFVQMLVDMGEITQEQAEHHPRKNEITNALGLPNMSPATVKEEPITPQAGDCFLLCSDGLSGMVNDHNIEKIISKQRELRTQERADLLVQTANENGGIDNITVELVEFTITPSSIQKSDNYGRKICVIICSLFLLCAIVCAGMWFWKSEPTLNSKLWGTVFFEKNKPVFTIKVDRQSKATIIQFADSVQVIKDLIKESQIRSNLEINETGGGSYILYFRDVPVDGDSVFVQLDFGKRRYNYILYLEKPKQHHQVLNEVLYKSGKKFAVLLYLPDCEIVLRIEKNDTISISGKKLDIESIMVQGAQYERSNNEWNIKFDTLERSDTVKIAFSCENGKYIYTYNIPCKIPFIDPGGRPNVNPSIIPPKNKVDTTKVPDLEILEKM